MNAKSFAFLKDTDDRWLNLPPRRQAVQPLDAGVSPDCAIERRFADRFTGRDSMLPAAVEAARTGRCAVAAPLP